MAKDYRTTKHRKFLIQFHIVLVVKYRKQLMFKFGRLIKSYLEIYSSRMKISTQEIILFQIQLG